MIHNLVSIIIPAYNAENFIEETIHSALNQTYKNIEIIVVDDCSTDNTLSKAKKFEEKGVIVVSKKNSGASDTRNKGFLLSKGDYIQYLDADDLLSPEKIENQLNYFAQFGDQIIVSSQWDRFADNHLSETQFPERFLDRDWDSPIEWLINSWMGKGMAQTSIWLTPRALIQGAGEWNTKMLGNDDGEFFCRVLLKAKKIYFCKDAYVYYRSNITNSLSQRPGRKNVEALLGSYSLYKKHILEVENSDRVKLALKQNFISFIYTYYDDYPEFVEIAKNEIQDLGLAVKGSTGGLKMKIIIFFLGFEGALKFRQYCSNLKKRF